MKILKLLNFIAILIAIILGAIFIAYLILEITNVIDQNHTLRLTFSILTPIVFILGAVYYSNYFSFLGVYKRLKQENFYYLGKESEFYNYYLLTRRLKRLNYKYRKEDKYVISFTPVKLSVLRNGIRNESVIKYLGFLSESIEKFFLDDHQKLYDKLSFCYYHGTFLVCIFGDIDLVNDTAAQLEAMAFDVASENKSNVYIQPYFGISKALDKKEEFIVTVEHANTARSDAESQARTYVYYDPNTTKDFITSSMKDIEEGIKNNEFVVYYQPKFSLKTNEFTSSEALVRWNSPKYGFVQPYKFIALVERFGLIHNLDMYVFKQVCKDLRENKRRGRRILPVSCNFSMQEFYDSDFVDAMSEVCNENQISPSLIQIEITESTSQANTFMTVQILKRLKEKGFIVLMDDFGTGYSNMQNLLDIPFDAIKLDRSYIKRIDIDNKAYELVKFLINLCKINEIEVIAEGVDNPTQVELLRKAKCDTIQGFYYSKPIPKDDFDKFLFPNGNQFEKGKKEGRR